MKQDIWTRAVDLPTGRISIFNERFFRPLDNVVLHWQLLSNGVSILEGDYDISSLKIQPQQTKDIKLPYRVANLRDETVLSLSYRLKDEEPLLSAGHEIAHQQFVIKDYDYAAAINAVVTQPDMTKLNIALQKKLDNQAKAIAQGKTVKLAPVAPAALGIENIRPNFWRAVTDNDMGAQLHNKYMVWRNPAMELKQTAIVTGKVLMGEKKEKVTIMTNIYDMPDVKGTLTVTYTTYPGGIVRMDQTFKPNADAKDVPGMFRFGVLADASFNAQQPNLFQDARIPPLDPRVYGHDTEGSGGTPRRRAGQQGVRYIERADTAVAIEKTDQMVLWIARPLHLFWILLFPVIRTFDFIAGLGLKALGIHRNRNTDGRYER